MSSSRKWLTRIFVLDITVLLLHTIIVFLQVAREEPPPDICRLLADTFFEGSAGVLAIKNACISGLEPPRATEGTHSGLVIGVHATGMTDATDVDECFASLLLAINRAGVHQKYTIFLYTDLEVSGYLLDLSIEMPRLQVASTGIHFKIISRSDWQLPLSSNHTFEDMPSLMEVLDTVHLMLLSSLHGKYYLQLSWRDVVAPNIFQEIETMLTNDTLSDLWISLDFGSTGLFGSVIRTVEIPKISRYIMPKLGRGPLSLLFNAYVRSVYPPCIKALHYFDNVCSLSPSLGRISYYPALVTPVFYNKDDYLLRHDPRLRIPMGYEPFPWEHVPMFVNPPAVIETSWETKGEHSLEDTYALNVSGWWRHDMHYWHFI